MWSSRCMTTAWAWMKRPKSASLSRILRPKGTLAPAWAWSSPSWSRGAAISTWIARREKARDWTSICPRRRRPERLRAHHSASQRITVSRAPENLKLLGNMAAVNLGVVSRITLAIIDHISERDAKIRKDGELQFTAKNTGELVACGARSEERRVGNA